MSSGTYPPSTWHLVADQCCAYHREQIPRDLQKFSQYRMTHIVVEASPNGRWSWELSEVEAQVGIAAGVSESHQISTGTADSATEAVAAAEAAYFAHKDSREALHKAHAERMSELRTAITSQEE